MASLEPSAVRSAPLVGGAVGAGGGGIGAVSSEAKAAPLERLGRSCGDGVVGA